ncbi:LysM peptidoglycan-binding domain-containing protein [Amycolatopsis thermoflava]|uniref:LysM peptidoglycan-binding domain-containing protein n=1 Tax=Amycolatopsis thermoflava TaxID=84480 RepID=UPI0036590D5F
MSVLTLEEWLVRRAPEEGAGGRVPVRPRRPEVRRPEVRRPPTRARVVAGRRPGPVAACPRRIAPRWPWLAAVGVAIALAVTGLGVFAGSFAPDVPERTATVAVTPGETLWDLARQYAPGSDTGAVVERIEELNHLPAESVVPGLLLTVPVESGSVITGS